MGNKRTIRLSLALVLVVCMLTGCVGNQMEVGIQADGTCSFMMRYYYEKQMTDLVLASGGSVSISVLNASGDFTQETVVRDGRTYYVLSRLFSFATVDEMKLFLTNADAYYQGMQKDSHNPSAYSPSDYSTPLFADVTADATQFVGTLTVDGLSREANGAGNPAYSDINELSRNEYYWLGGASSLNEYYKAQGGVLDLSVTLPSPIMESNGTIAGNTASWSLDNLAADHKLMAFSSTGNMDDTTPPVITGAKNNKIYNKAVGIQVEDNVNVKTILANGKGMDSTSLYASVTGKYEITATDYSGNSTQLTFYIDTVYPKILGLKNGKISKKGIALRFRDNMGIKSVQINGKSANTKKVTLRKPGKYTIQVKDQAGNVTRRSFRIRKYTSPSS